MFLIVLPHIQKFFFPESTVCRDISDSHKANHTIQAAPHCRWSNGVDMLASLFYHMEKNLLNFKSCHIAWLHFNSLLVQKPALCIPHVNTEVSPSPNPIKERHPEQKPHCIPRAVYEGHSAPQHRGNSKPQQSQGSTERNTREKTFCIISF